MSQKDESRVWQVFDSILRTIQPEMIAKNQSRQRPRSTSSDLKGRGIGAISDAACCLPFFLSKTDHRQGNLNYAVRTQRGETQKSKNFSRSQWIVRSGRPPITETFVPGLPANFYDHNWLRSLTKFERSPLKIQPRIDLEPPCMTRSVSLSIPSIIPIMKSLMTVTVFKFGRALRLIM